MLAPLSWCKIAIPHGTGKRYISVAFLPIHAMAPISQAHNSTLLIPRSKI
jgi:hypothetical protein